MLMFLSYYLYERLFTKLNIWTWYPRSFWAFDQVFDSFPYFWRDTSVRGNFTLFAKFRLTWSNSQIFFKTVNDVDLGPWQIAEKIRCLPYLTHVLVRNVISLLLIAACCGPSITETSLSCRFRFQVPRRYEDMNPHIKDRRRRRYSGKIKAIF